MMNSTTIVPLIIPRVTVLVIVASSLSLIGASIIIVAGILFKDLTAKIPAIRIIFWLSIADLLSSIFFLCGSVTNMYHLLRNDSWWCTTQGVGLQFSVLCSFFWTACFSHRLYLSTTRANIHKHLNLIYHTVSWVPALVVSLITIPMIADTGYWCWISDQYSVWRFVFFFGPLWIIMVFNATIYVQVLRTTRNQRQSLWPKLTWYLVIFILCNSFSTANRIQNVVNPNNPIEWLLTLQAIFDPLQGFLNCLVYGFTMPAVRDRYRELIVGPSETDRLIIQ